VTAVDDDHRDDGRPSSIVSPDPFFTVVVSVVSATVSTVVFPQSTVGVVLQNILQEVVELVAIATDGSGGGIERLEVRVL